MNTITTEDKDRLKPPALLQEMHIERGETQKNVNRAVLEMLDANLDKSKSLKMLDLPCGKGKFLSYCKQLFPGNELHGADIVELDKSNGIQFHQMDLTQDFTLPEGSSFDVVTSISGVMMFENTRNFIENCSNLLKKDGTFVVTNDNSATIIDKLSFLLLGRTRQFRLVYEDDEGLKQNLSIQALVRMVRNADIEITDIRYTSFYPKDLIFLPLILLVAPFKYWHLSRSKANLPEELTKKMYNFRHFLCKHYIIMGKKK